RRSVLLVARVPRLDGAPGELKALPVLIQEGLFTDMTDARNDGVARRRLDGAEYAHLEVTTHSFHGVLSGRYAPAPSSRAPLTRTLIAVWCCRRHRSYGPPRATGSSWRCPRVESAAYLSRTPRCTWL